MLVSVKELAKYVIIIYPLGGDKESLASESKALQSRSIVEVSGPANVKNG